MLGRLCALVFCATVMVAQEVARLPELEPIDTPRPVATTLELQVELHRRGFSCGSIDGLPGAQTAAALRAFQRGADLRESGVLDAATKDALRISFAALDPYNVTENDLADLQPVPTTWLGKSERTNLGFATLLERLAERYRSSPKLLQRLNPNVNWDTVAIGDHVVVPAVEQALLMRLPARLVIRLEARELEAMDADGRVVAHFPVSIAKKAEKRPAGDLHIAVLAREPNYTFDPEVFSESAEARELGRKLIIPPGPNNPVGRAWIGLDLPGYGIHGTPDPEKIGRTESHGCFRLANWDALTLIDLVRIGMVVTVEP